MSEIAKPALDAQGRVRYEDAITYLENKYDFDSRDFSGSQSYYAKWCKKHGKRPNPSAVADQQSQWSEYCAAPDGEQAEPPYENFWHWLLDLAQPLGGKRPSFYRLDISKVLSTYDITHAVLQQTLQEATAKQAQAAIALLPSDLRERAARQLAPKPTELQPFVRTILGYFQAEFGAVVNLNLRPY